MSLRSDYLVIFLAMGLVTYGCRFLFTLCFSKIKLNAYWNHVLSLIPLAVLSAVIAPLMVFPASGANGLNNPYLFCGLLAFFISYWTRSTFVSVVVSVIVFALWLRA